jgi:hypothetical protein
VCVACPLFVVIEFDDMWSLLTFVIYCCQCYLLHICSLKKQKQSRSIQCTEALYGAMNRMAQFFVTPKFDRDMVDRELQEIDSEYRNGITNDAIS